MKIRFLDIFKKERKKPNESIGDMIIKIDALTELRSVQYLIEKLEKERKEIPQLNERTKELIASQYKATFNEAIDDIEKELKESGFVWHAANVYGDYEPWESLSKFFRDIMEYCGESHDKQEKIDKLKEKEKTLKESLGIK